MWDKQLLKPAKCMVIKVHVNQRKNGAVLTLVEVCVCACVWKIAKSLHNWLFFFFCLLFPSVNHMMTHHDPCSDRLLVGSTGTVPVGLRAVLARLRSNIIGSSKKMTELKSKSTHQMQLCHPYKSPALVTMNLHSRSQGRKCLPASVHVTIDECLNG